MLLSLSNFPLTIAARHGFSRKYWRLPREACFLMREQKRLFTESMQTTT